jgi:glucose-1-phosphate thymidylyltransferase
MRGIVLAGGTGSRLWPITTGVSKQLLPVYDKPMIHYPLATLMTVGVRDILVITTTHEQSAFQRLLADGSEFGVNLSYATQDAPRGIADAFRVGAAFIGDEPVALILGDNIFHGPGLGSALRQRLPVDGGLIFAYRVADPTAYGVVSFDDQMRATGIEEKPQAPKSPYAVPGLYFYDNSVVALATDLQPSARGELEITDVNRAYLDQGRLSVTVLPRGTAWLDTGTFSSLHEAAEYVRILERRQGTKVGCVWEVAWRHGWIDDEQMLATADALANSGFGDYLRGLVERAEEGALDV